ncbi:MAG: hypothetical protein AB7O86_11385 [Porticoccaceae bacterium]
MFQQFPVGLLARSRVAIKRQMEVVILDQAVGFAPGGLPVVLTVAEMRAVPAQVIGTRGLMLRLLYGSRHGHADDAP